MWKVDKRNSVQVIGGRKGGRDMERVETRKGEAVGGKGEGGDATDRERADGGGREGNNKKIDE